MRRGVGIRGPFCRDRNASSTLMEARCCGSYSSSPVKMFFLSFIQPHTACFDVCVGKNRPLPFFFSFAKRHTLVYTTHQVKECAFVPPISSTFFVSFVCFSLFSQGRTTSSSSTRIVSCWTLGGGSQTPASSRASGARRHLGVDLFSNSYFVSSSYPGFGFCLSSRVFSGVDLR